MNDSQVLRKEFEGSTHNRVGSLIVILLLERLESMNWFLCDRDLYHERVK